MRRAPEPVGDRQAAVLAAGAAGGLGPRRGLAAFVLGPVDQAHDLGHGVAVEPLGDQLVDAGVVLDVGLQDRVEDLVGGRAGRTPGFWGTRGMPATPPAMSPYRVQ